MKKSDAFSMTAIARANYARNYTALVTLLVFIAALGLGFILRRFISRGNLSNLGDITRNYFFWSLPLSFLLKNRSKVQANQF
jgi:hypothetical protein